MSYSSKEASFAAFLGCIPEDSKTKFLLGLAAVSPSLFGRFIDRSFDDSTSVDDFVAMIREELKGCDGLTAPSLPPRSAAPRPGPG